MKDSVEYILEQVIQFGQEMLFQLRQGEAEAEDFSKKAVSLSQLIGAFKNAFKHINALYKDYEEYCNSFNTFCSNCMDTNFLINNVETMDSSLELFVECMEDFAKKYVDRRKICPCCGKVVVYSPLSGYYDDMEKRFGVINESKSETINKSEYICPACGASDRDRMIISFFKKISLQEASEGIRLLQFAPAQPITRWIERYCPQVEYETTDLLMKAVSFPSDIQDMYMVEDESYDVIICSHVLEHVQDDKKALSEMRRILKPGGKIVFLVPVDLNAHHIDEEWGLSEEENWRRFAQGDHCRRYSKDGLMERLEEWFHVYSLGKSYFGEEVYKQCGLTDTSTLYVLTKGADVPLDMAERFIPDEKLCREGPLVSVIMSCFNHGRFVADAIESVIHQSYKNIEFIVADDGSADNSVEIMKQYSSYYTKELYFKENAGGRFPMLRKFAKGKYIALINSDDVWEHDKLAIQVEYMEQHEECGACFTWCTYTDENLKPIDDLIFIQKNRNPYEWMRFFWEHGNALCNPSTLIRREFRLRDQRYGAMCWQLPDFFLWVDLVQICQFHIVQKSLTKMRRYRLESVANVSANTEENRRRHLVEEGTNWIWVISDMDKEFFKMSFRDLMIHADADSEEEIECEKFFLLLRHGNMFVQNSALCYLTKIYNRVKDCLENQYGYTIKEIKRDMVKMGLARTISIK